MINQELTNAAIDECSKRLVIRFPCGQIVFVDSVMFACGKLFFCHDSIKNVADIDVFWVIHYQLPYNEYLTRKRGNCECNATWGRPTPRQSFFAFIWRHAKFEVARPVHCRVIAYVLLIHYFKLWHWPLNSWPWPWTFAVYRIVMKLCAKFERNPAICGVVIAISVFDLMTWTCVMLCCARLWDNFNQVLPSTTYPCLNYSVFMLIRYVTLWPWPSTRWPWRPNYNI